MTLRCPLTRCILLIVALVAGLALLPPAASAQSVRDDDHIVYLVRKGDTLIEMGRAYFIRTDDWRLVQRLNRVANPRRMPVALRLRLPLDILKYRPATATVAAFRGEAQASAPRVAATALALGQTLGEGARVSTGPASSLSLALSDGSVISLPSNSSLRIARLRRLLITDSIDYDLSLENGAVRSRVTPFRNGQDRFRLRNPIAVSAVRGTDFRSRFDAASTLAFAELIEGGLAIRSDAGSDAETTLPAQFGAVVGRPDGIATERLLEPPVLASGGSIQRGATLGFTVGAVAGAKGYRLQIARDSGFIEVVDDRQGLAPDFVVSSLPNGNYFARATAIAASGLEGMPGTAAFKRRLNTLAASGGASADGYTFRWIGSGDGIRRYRFQIRKQGAAALLVDEAELATSSIIISDLAPGTYGWRVGTTLYAEGEVDSVWTEFESFTVDE